MVAQGIRNALHWTALLLIGGLVGCASAPPAKPDTSIKALWIPMDSDPADGALTSEALLAFSTGFVEISETDYSALAGAVGAADATALDPAQLLSAEQSVRLLVLYHGNIQMISDGCHLVDPATARGIALPALLVSAIEATPPKVDRWSCHGG